MKTGFRRKSLLAIPWGVMVFIAMLVTLAWFSPLYADDDDEFVPDQVIVKLDPASGAAIEHVNASYGTTTLDILLGSASIYLLQIAPGQTVEAVVEAMQDDPRLLYAEPNFIGELPEADRGGWGWGGYDPAPYLGQYAAEMLNLAEAHAVTLGAGVVVAILDTGAQLDHPRLVDHFTAARYDFIDDDAIPVDELNGLDDDGDSLIDEGIGHGTHVAGIVNLVAPQAHMMPLRVLDSDGRGDEFIIAEAIQYAAQNGAEVINLSLGMSATSELLEDIIEDVAADGVVIVAAAGNLNSSSMQYPAASESILAVTSVGPAYLKSPFANYGTWVDIAAPGESITSTFPINGYAQSSGTSMATSFVTGQATLIRSLAPSMSVADVAELIRSSAQPLDEFNPGYSGLLGAGLADIGGSLHYTPVSCGQVLTTSVLLGRDLTDCPGDGLIIGAAGITLDLGGHTIDGVGLGAGIRNDGFASVTITNGTVQEFDFGVQLTAGAALNTIASLTAQLNQEAGIQLSDAGNGNTLSSNAVVGNKIGIALMDGAPGAVVIDNTIAGNSGHGLHLARSSGNLLQANRVAGSSDLAVLLEEASGNTLVGNTISDSSDGALAILAGSNGNRVEGNTLTATGDAGMRVADSDGNELIANTVQAVGDTAVILENAHNNRVEGNTLTEGGDAGIYVANSAGNQLLSNTVQQMSDSGIVLNNAHGGVVRGNDLRFNAGGIELDSATGNLIESNDASHSVGTGIELEAESLGNVVVMNVASLNGGRGIAVEAELLPESLAAGNLLDRNTASGNNAGGIYIGKAGHTLAANSADNNVGWGIYVQVGNADGGGNTAAGNTEPPQCFNVACNAAPPAPPPTPSPTPTTEPTATPTPTATPEPTATPVPTPEPTATPPPDCGPAVTLSAEADAWIDQNSASNNYGSDSILKVQAKSGNNFRALIRFGLPAAPQGCAVESATLRLYAPSWKNRRTLQALRISGDWTESQVTWGNQPETTGPAATTGSGSGYRQWDVAAQVQAMYDNGANHGFLIRDANEGGGGSEQQFHSREKGESMPELVITFGPAGG